MSGFLGKEQNQNKKPVNPFAKKGATVDTKVTKISADLHYILKNASAMGIKYNSITDHVNKAVEEYIEKHNLEEQVKR